MPLAERLDQLDLAGQMFRVVWPDAMQFIQQFPRDQLRRGVLHAVDHPVSHRKDRFKTILLLDPINQEISCRFVIGDGETETGLRFSIRVVKHQIRPAQADAVNFSIKSALQRFFNLVQRELDTRRTDVDGQDARQISFHGSQSS